MFVQELGINKPVSSHLDTFIPIRCACGNKYSLFKFEDNRLSQPLCQNSEAWIFMQAGSCSKISLSFSDGCWRLYMAVIDTEKGSWLFVRGE